MTVAAIIDDATIHDYGYIKTKYLFYLDAVCGYSSCHPTDPTKLNVHLLAHSHDDVGWLKTVDQYFLGSNREGWEYENHQVGVQYVIDTVMRSLGFNEDRK